MNDFTDIALPASWLTVVHGHAEAFPQRAALALREHRISYQELTALVDKTACLLHDAGVRRGDSVALLSPARPEAVITFLACTRLGAIWLSLNPKYKEPEIDYIINHAKPRLVLSVDTFDGVDYVGPVGRSVDTLQRQTGVGSVPVAYFDPRDSTPASMLNALAGVARTDLQAQDDPLCDISLNIDDPCMLVYTSGTTGQPKGVLLPQKSSLFRATVQSTYFKTREPARIVNFSPINHVGGMQFRSLSVLAAGGTVFFQERFSAGDTLQLIRQHRINMLMLGPTMLHLLVQHDSFDVDIFQQLEWYISAGAPLPTASLRMIAQHCPQVASVYGSTEACSTVSYASLDDSFDAVAYSIGWPLPAGEMRVVDENGNTVGPLQDGELQIRSEYCMSGYLNDPESTREAITADGWFKSGDIATVEEDGSFRLIGRIKEMFKSGGYNVYPREVEILLETHPAVKMAAIVPVDDPVFQQVGHAFILLDNDATETGADLIAWCKERLANYKVPKRITICPELPMLAIGKVDKISLKERARGQHVEPVIA